MTTTPPTPTGGLEESAPRSERFRHAYTAEERRKIFDQVLLERLSRWRARFSIMMVLSIVIASLGLLADSPAIVIGAMLIAPLITPIQALAVAICMGWGWRAVRYAAVIVAATIGGVALAAVIAMVVPPVSALPNEVLIRTSPDLRDLLIAIAAGAAGAYATAREDVSSALPGVAVAVALVPPLATVGVAVSIGHGELAGGALLLFVANLVAILFAAIAVLFVTGFVPVPHFRRVKARVVSGMAAVSVAMVLIGIPLTGALANATDEARLRQKVAEAVLGWIGTARLEVNTIDLGAGTVLVDLQGPDAPPPVELLTAALDQLMGDTEVSVRWSQRAEVAPGSGSGDDAQIDEVRAAISQWISDSGAVFVIEDLERVDGVVVAELAGPDAPDATSLLASLTEAGVAPETLQLRWTLQRVVDPSTLTPERLAIRSAVDRWAASWPGMVVTDVIEEPDRLLVVVEGPTEPDDVDLLADDLMGLSGWSRSVDVRFTIARTISATEARHDRIEGVVASWSRRWGVEVTDVAPGATDVAVRTAAAVDPALVGRLSDALADALAVFVRVTVTGPEGGPVRSSAVPTGDDTTTVWTLGFTDRSTEPDDPGVLSSVVRDLERDPRAVVLVIGHARASGSPEEDRDLARQRAINVREALMELGAPSDRVHIRVDGSSSFAQPRVDVATWHP